ncbi:MAG: outer membrane lipoprotein chaperone LolA [Cryobacterium sp.]|nr:outer membrane lipoprotein chaperone LolA [Oligoflexia bacterium]
MEPPSLIPSDRSRHFAILVAAGFLFLQLFADQTIATEKKFQVFSAHEKAKTKPALKPVIVPDELAVIERKYVAAKTLQADFAQKDDIKLTGTQKVASGVLMIRHPNQFRWETLKPDKNLLVSDGSKFWFYTPPFEAGERGQVIERKTSEVQSELANHVLSGAFSKMHGVEITKLSSRRFKLIPAEGVAGTVKSAEIEIDPAKGVIEKLTLEHTGGNHSAITLSNVTLGSKMADAFFHFATPPATDVIRE